MMSRLFFISLGLFFLMGQLRATHNRAGDITYEHLDGYTYRVTVTTCTKISAPADRPELTEFDWGDGSPLDTLPRASIQQTGPDHQKNIYYGVHTYAGPGTYTMKMYDPNRNSDILNIQNSVYEPFCLHTTLVISPIYGENNSVILQECPCPEYACVFKRYCYTMGAFDPDGDSLAFELAVPYGGQNCDEMLLGVNYLYPDAPLNTGSQFTGGGGQITIDPLTGTLCWDAPQIQGEFNVAIRIKEYRQGFFIGSVVRDIQITVTNCNNNPPDVQPLPDTCIAAGSSINFNVLASDPDAGDIVTIETYGQPYTFPSPNTATYVDNSPSAFVTGTFNWTTSCLHVRNAPYTVTFEAIDNDPQVPLTDVETAFIKVFAPAVQNLTATPQGNTIILSWSPSVCTNIIGYRIYRHIGTVPYTDDCCEPGAPQAMGYELIGTTSGWNATTFVDNSGLVLGTDYCYLVVALFNPVTESCVSDQVCAQLLFDSPVLTHVTIDVTDASGGTDTVIWAMPKELDTLVQFNGGSFYYNVYRAQGMGTSPVTLVHTTPTSSSLALTDTIFFDTGLNTFGLPYTYRVELVYNNPSGGQVTLGGGPAASSVYVNSTPADNEVTLTWNSVVPWQETSYEVYREASVGSGVFNLLGTTTTKTYTDTGLANGQEYCYRVKAIGTYGNATIVDPLINWSQVVCETPIDMTAPCPPVLTMDPDCQLDENTLVWNNPNFDCADDVMSYNVYFSPTDTGEFTLLATIGSNTDTVYVHNNNGSVAGCYYVTAIDSAQYGNESVASNIICADNCPYYWLPNVFTPNNDGTNDRFEPFPYRQVESIDIQIFNRWGQLMFQTTDPDVKWDGTAMDSGEPVSEGAYYYVCTVNTIRLAGIEPIVLKGFVTVVRGTNFSGN